VRRHHGAHHALKHAARQASRPPMQLSRQHRRWLYLTGALLWASGVAWLINHYFFKVAGEFADAPQPSEAWWLRLHGAAMIGFLIAFGALLPVHVLHGWRQRRNRRSGVMMLVIVGALALSGYGLYYAGDERLRPWISATHWVIGLAVSAALLLHVILGRRTRL
jgi:cation transport ATPase